MSLIGVFFGILILCGIYFKAMPNEKTIVLIYILAVFTPTNILPIFFWVVIYFYYGACVNSSFVNLRDQLNDVGNILDSIKTQIFKENLFVRRLLIFHLICY